MGLELTQRVHAGELAECFEAQPDELFEVLAELISGDDPEGRVVKTMLLLDGFVPNATATKGGREMMLNVASLLEQMSIALKAAVNAAEAKLTVVR